MFGFLKGKEKLDPELEGIITPEVDAAYESYKDEFLKYLEDKYQRKFLPIALYPEMEFLEFRAYPEGGDRKKDEIHLYMHDYATDHPVIEDNYFFETIRDEYDAYMKDVIKDYFESFKVFYAKEHRYPYARDLKLGDTWEYIRSNGIEFDMDILLFTDDELDDETFITRFYDLLQTLYKNKVYGVLSVLNIKKGFLEKVNEANEASYRNSLREEYEMVRIREEQECIVKPERWEILDDDRMADLVKSIINRRS